MGATIDILLPTYTVLSKKEWTLLIENAEHAEQIAAAMVFLRDKTKPFLAALRNSPKLKEYLTGTNQFELHKVLECIKADLKAEEEKKKLMEEKKEVAPPGHETSKKAAAILADLEKTGSVTNQIDCKKYAYLFSIMENNGILTDENLLAFSRLIPRDRGIFSSRVEFLHKKGLRIGQDVFNLLIKNPKDMLFISFLLSFATVDMGLKLEHQDYLALAAKAAFVITINNALQTLHANKIAISRNELALLTENAEHAEKIAAAMVFLHDKSKPFDRALYASPFLKQQLNKAEKFELQPILKFIEEDSRLVKQYARGVDLIKNEKFDAAVKIFTDLAEKGLGHAQIDLAICYMAGKGVAADEKKAVQLLDKACAQGYDDAIVLRSWCYIKGIGGIKNETMVSKLLVIGDIINFGRIAHNPVLDNYLDEIYLKLAEHYAEKGDRERRNHFCLLATSDIIHPGKRAKWIQEKVEELSNREKSSEKEESHRP